MQINAHGSAMKTHRYLKLPPPLPTRGRGLKMAIWCFERTLEIDIASCFEKTRKCEIADCLGGVAEFCGQICLLSGLQIGVGSCFREKVESCGALAQMIRRRTVDFLNHTKSIFFQQEHDVWRI